jgi:hypothetical protein
MATTYINPFISNHVPQLWSSLLAEFGRDLDYWPGGNQAQSVTVPIIWIEGTEDEEVSPGRYSHALVQNSELPAPPELGDSLTKDGTVFDVVRVNAFAYYFAELVLQERGDVPVGNPFTQTQIISGVASILGTTSQAISGVANIVVPVVGGESAIRLVPIIL